MTNRLRSTGYCLLAIVLVGIAFLAARHPAGPEDRRVTIKVAHKFLHPGIRRALNDIARRYEALHPAVHIEYLEVPQTLWASWLTTQLVGDDPPELINSGVNELTDEQISRYLEPIGEDLDVPNPYNRSNDLKDAKWRDTFANGLNDSYSFSERMNQYYAVPTSFVTTRFFYNKTLFRKLLGSDEPPRSYAEFIRDCDRLAQPANRESQPVIPIASSILTARVLLQKVMQHCTQTLVPAIDRPGLFRITELDSMLSLVGGEWRPDEGCVKEGWQTFREISRRCQEGFLTADRDQGTFLFLQQKAAMYFSATYDAEIILKDPAFEVGIFALPLPDRSEAGARLRPTTEADIGLNGGFSVVRTSAHHETAIDFLRFLTSQEEDAVFAQASLRLPAVRGLKAAAELHGFEPLLQGAVPGLRFDLQGFGAGFTDLLITHNLFRLMDPRPGAFDAFLGVMADHLAENARLDLERYERRLKEDIIQEEISFVARRKVEGDLDPSMQSFRDRIDLQERNLIRIDSVLSP